MLHVHKKVQHAYTSQVIQSSLHASQVVVPLVSLMQQQRRLVPCMQTHLSASLLQSSMLWFAALHPLCSDTSAGFLSTLLLRFQGADSRSLAQHFGRKQHHETRLRPSSGRQTAGRGWRRPKTMLRTFFFIVGAQTCLGLIG